VKVSEVVVCDIGNGRVGKGEKEKRSSGRVEKRKKESDGSEMERRRKVEGS
jgi:hypothetical protein